MDVVLLFVAGTCVILVSFGLIIALRYVDVPERWRFFLLANIAFVLIAWWHLRKLLHAWLFRLLFLVWITLHFGVYILLFKGGVPLGAFIIIAPLEIYIVLGCFGMLAASAKNRKVK